MRARTIALALALVACLAAACAGPDLSPSTAVAPPTASNSSPVVWPTTGWQSTPPELQAMDAERLSRMYAEIERRRTNVHAVLVIRHGIIVSERYWPPYDEATRHELFSVTKSFVSALVGIAVAEGRIEDVMTPVALLLTDQRDVLADPDKRAITLEDLLTMRSGLAWIEGDPAYTRMVRSRDWVESVLDLPMQEAPGTRFNYCSGCTHVLAVALHHSVNRDLFDYADERLFAPLGIQNIRWERDRAGTPIGGWGLWLTPRDMAKLGYLYLHNGRWEQRQIVSSEWVHTSVTRHTETDSEFGYGYQWWTDERRGAFFARGRGGQLIVIIPRHDLIVVFTADVPDDQVLFALIDDYVIPAVRDEQAVGG